MPKIRAFQDGDATGVQRLFELCHKRPLPPEVWRWRYAAQAEGAPVTEVAVQDGAVVAHLSALPVRLERGGESTPAGLWVDLMVHPSYRNLELFLDLAESNRRRCAEAGLKIVFAFPNDKSYPVLKRMLGWLPIAEIRALEAPLAALERPAAPAGWKFESLADFGPECDALWGKLKPPASLAVSRAPARLNWRYRGRPGSVYPVWSARDGQGRLKGWLAAKVFAGPQGRIGDILDFWAESGPAEDGLLAAAFDHFRSEGAQTVSAWALAHTPQHARLSAWGLSEGADVTHFAGRWTAESAPAFPSRAEDWCVAKGDSDVF